MFDDGLIKIFSVKMKNLKLSFTVIATLVLFLTTMQVHALTYYSRVAAFTFAGAGNNWSTSATGGTLVAYPGPTHDYIIQTGNNVTILANQTAVSVTVKSGGTLTAGTFTLTAPLTIDSGGTLALAKFAYVQAGNLTNNGAITGTTGRLTMNTFTLDNAGSISLTTGRIERTTGALTNSGSITMGAGRFTNTSGFTTNEATGTIAITGVATVTLGTNDFVNNNTSASVDFGTSTVGLTSTAQSVGGFTTTGAVNPSNVSGTITITGDIYGATFTKSGAGTINMGAGLTHTFTGSFSISAGILNGNSSTLRIGGVATYTGTFNANTCTIDYYGSSAQTVPGVTYYNLEFSGAGTKTIATGTTITVGNNWIVGSATTMATTANANVTASISGAGNITMGSGTIFLEGDWTNSGTFTRGTGTVNYDGADAQAIAALVYNNLRVTIGGTKTLVGNTTVNGILTVSTPATLDLSTFTVTLPLTGTPLVNTGTLAGTGKVLFSGAGAQTVAGTTYYDLEFSGAGTKTILTTTTIVATNNWIVGSPTTLATSGGANITGDISGSGVISMGSGQIALEGDWTNSATLVRGTGTVIYDGSGAQIVGAQPYYILQTATGGTKTLAGNSSIASVLTIGASSELDLSTYTLTLNAASIPLVNNGSFKPGTSTVAYTNAGSTTITAVNYYNLNGTGGPRVFPGAGVIGIANVFTPGAGAYTVTGSTVSFNGSGDQTIPTFTFNDVILTNAGAKTIDSAVSVKNITIETGPTLNLNSSGSGILTIY